MSDLVRNPEEEFSHDMAHLLSFSMSNLQEAVQCFTDHEITEQFMDYLKEDSSMNVFNDALQLLSIGMDSLDTMMAALNDYCGASTGKSYLNLKRAKKADYKIMSAKFCKKLSSNCIMKNKRLDHYANTPMQYTVYFQGCKNDNFR